VKLWVGLSEFVIFVKKHIQNTTTMNAAQNVTLGYVKGVLLGQLQCILLSVTFAEIVII
jgi:hypothetical protein